MTMPSLRVFVCSLIAGSLIIGLVATEQLDLDLALAQANPYMVQSGQTITVSPTGGDDTGNLQAAFAPPPPPPPAPPKPIKTASRPCSSSGAAAWQSPGSPSISPNSSRVTSGGRGQGAAALSVPSSW